jgi:hypothetical protein
MITDITLNKQVPAGSGNTVLDISGANPDGFALTIVNQDASSTLVYKLQSSSDGGSTWTDISFPTTGGGSQSVFTIIAGNVQTLRVVDNSPRIRVQAYGDLMATFSIKASRHHSLADSTSISI